jgi:DNA-directed RNA polymerase subunit beta'
MEFHDRLKSKKLGEFDDQLLSNDDIEAALRQELQENDEE